MGCENNNTSSNASDTACSSLISQDISGKEESSSTDASADSKNNSNNGSSDSSVGNVTTSNNKKAESGKENVTTTTSSVKGDENKGGTADNGGIKVENVATTEEVTEQKEIFEIKEEIKVISKHTPISSQQYYQYSSLNSKEKAVYNTILDGINNTKNIINVKDLGINHEVCLLVLQKVLADHPEIFYVSRYTKSSYDPNTQKANALYVYYTDGVVTDKLDENNELTVVADRTVIANKIKKLSEKVQSVLNNIPASASQLDKEKQIHDYIINNTVYDSTAANSISSYKDLLPHSFDIYGALCGGKAVCEGYSKLFQYLCYCVGINSTQIIGTGNGGNHMWNAVKINDDWYMLDATWDDTSEIPLFDYFNITSKDLNKDHIINTDLAYPECTSTRASFVNSFSLDISKNQLPSNYKQIIDAAVANNESYLYLYIGNGISESFITDNIFSDDSLVCRYIKEKNYCITFESGYSYATGSKYAYIKLIR